MIHQFIDTLEELQDAKKDYQEKAEVCQQDHDYFLHEEKKRIDDAKEDLAAAFKSAVMQAVIQLKNEGHL